MPIAVFVPTFSPGVLGGLVGIAMMVVLDDPFLVDNIGVGLAVLFVFDNLVPVETFGVELAINFPTSDATALRASEGSV